MISKIDLYRIFLTVSENKSFSKAAQQLYMTQPAVSQAIAKLEVELGTSLFYRNPKGIILTNEGKVLHDYVNQAMSILNAGEGKIQEFKNLTAGTLRIGVGDTIARFFLLPFLELFYTKYPGIHLQVKNGTTKEIVQFIKAGEADLGICNLPIQDEMIHVQPCKEVQDIFVCGHKYKNLTTSVVTLEHLLKMPLIFLETSANSRDYVESFLKSEGYHFTPEFELGSHDLLLQFAKINLGIACVTKEFSKEELQRGDLFEIKVSKPIPKRSIGIVTLKSIEPSQAAKKFIQLINE